MKSRIMWFLVGLVAIWIISLPFICRAEVPRPWSSEDKALVVWGGLGAAADIYATTQFLRNPNNWEINPIIGRHPDPAAVVSYIVTEYLISITIAYFLPVVELPIFGKIDLRQQILYNRASKYTANACWNARLDWD